MSWSFFDFCSPWPEASIFETSKEVVQKVHISSFLLTQDSVSGFFLSLLCRAIFFLWVLNSHGFRLTRVYKTNFPVWFRTPSFDAKIQINVKTKYFIINICLTIYRISQKPSVAFLCKNPEYATSRNLKRELFKFIHLFTKIKKNHENSETFKQFYMTNLHTRL